MTEDEKKAIEYLMLMKDRMEFNRLGYVYGADSIDIILNLIEEQQKELDKKEEQMENLEMEHSLKLIGKEEEIETNMREIIEEYYVPKEAIREKIKELEKYIYVGKNAPQDFLQYRVKAQIRILNEILGE